MTAANGKRIVFYTESPSTGGVSAVVEEIAVSASLHYNCTVVCQDNETLRIWGDTFRTRNIAVARVALKNNADLSGWLELTRLWGIYRVFREADLVHVHLHTTFSCLPALFIAKLVTRKKVVTTEHYVTQLGFIRKRHLPFFSALLRELAIRSKLTLKKLSLRAVDRIVSVSDSNRNFFLSFFGRRYDSKITSIANGVDVARYATVPTPDAEANESPCIAVIAGLNNQKGHEYLIRAVPLIQQHCPRVKVVFAGDGHLRRQLEQLTHDERVSDAIAFAGHVEDVRPLLARASVVVLPSLFEGMPISILEAMAAGKAVVATNVDGTAEVVVDGVTGFLVPPKNHELLAQKIVTLLRDRPLRDRFGRNGLSRVETLYSLERMTSDYLGLFKQLLSEV